MTLNTQINLGKKKKKGTTLEASSSWLQNIYQSYSNQNVIQAAHESWRILSLIYLCLFQKHPIFGRCFAAVLSKNTVVKHPKLALTWPWKCTCCTDETWRCPDVIVVVQSPSCVLLFATPWTAAHQASLSITSSPSLLKLNVHWVTENIQTSNSLSSPFPPAFNLSQHQGLFKWVSSLHQVAKVLKFQLQHQSFQWILRTDFLQDGLVGSPCSPRDSQESCPTPQFKNINS